MDNLHEHTDNATEQMREVASQLEALIEAIQGEELDGSRLDELNETMKRLADIERHRFGQSNTPEQQVVATKLEQLRRTAEQLLRYFMNQKATGNEAERAAQEEVRRSEERERARRVAEQAASAAATVSRQMAGTEPVPQSRRTDEDDGTPTRQPLSAQQAARHVAQVAAEVARQMREGGDGDSPQSSTAQQVARQAAQMLAEVTRQLQEDSPEQQQPPLPQKGQEQPVASSEQPSNSDSLREENGIGQPKKDEGPTPPTLIGTMREIGRGIRWLTNAVRGSDSGGQGQGGIFQAGAQVAAIHAMQSQAMGVLQVGNPLAYDTMLGSLKLLTTHLSSAFTPAAMQGAKTLQDLTGYVDRGIAGFRNLDDSMGGQISQFIKYGAVVGVATLALSKLVAMTRLLRLSMLGTPWGAALAAGGFVLHQMHQRERNERLGRGFPQLDRQGERDDDGLDVFDRIEQKKRIRMKDVEPYLTGKEADEFRKAGNDERKQRDLMFQIGAKSVRELEQGKALGVSPFSGPLGMVRDQIQALTGSSQRFTFGGIEPEKLAKVFRETMFTDEFRNGGADRNLWTQTRHGVDQMREWGGKFIPGLNEDSNVLFGAGGGENSLAQRRREMLERTMREKFDLTVPQSQHFIKQLKEKNLLGDILGNNAGRIAPEAIEQVSKQLEKLGKLPFTRLELAQKMRDAGVKVDVEGRQKMAMGRMNELQPQITSLADAWKNVELAQLGMSQIDTMVLQKQRENMRDAVREGLDGSVKIKEIAKSTDTMSKKKGPFSHS